MARAPKGRPGNRIPVRNGARIRSGLSLCRLSRLSRRSHRARRGLGSPREGGAHAGVVRVQYRPARRIRDQVRQQSRGAISTGVTESSYRTNNHGLRGPRLHGPEAPGHAARGHARRLLYLWRGCALAGHLCPSSAASAQRRVRTGCRGAEPWAHSMWGTFDEINFLAHRAKHYEARPGASRLCPE